jgi:hypothetical protein
MEQGVQNGSVTRQRIVRTEEQILKLLEEYEKSGFTANEFAEVSDIHEATFYSWLRKYPRSGSEEVKRFATIEVTKFDEAKFTDKKRAEYAIEQYQKLYAIEKYCRKNNLSFDER